MLEASSFLQQPKLTIELSVSPKLISVTKLAPVNPELEPNLTASVVRTAAICHSIHSQRVWYSRTKHQQRAGEPEKENNPGAAVEATFE